MRATNDEKLRLRELSLSTEAARRGIDEGRSEIAAAPYRELLHERRRLSMLKTQPTTCRTSVYQGPGNTMPIKVRFFYAVGPTDWRGLYKHNVA